VRYEAIGPLLATGDPALPGLLGRGLDGSQCTPNHAGEMLGLMVAAGEESLRSLFTGAQESLVKLFRH